MESQTLYLTSNSECYPSLLQKAFASTKISGTGEMDHKVE